MVQLAQLTKPLRGASPRGRRAAPPQRYMAFLSYSHDDAATAAWVHESLESFKVPHRLIGRMTDHGAVPKRLAPIFRDRQELAASHDLSEDIEEAIAASRFMIVLCSPAAAQSRWIDEEIACFKRLHGEERILAAILAGEPFASDDPDLAAEECFPPSLRVRFDGRGRPTQQRAEPIAADLREQADGRRLGLLKIAAGMLGVGLDELAQREAQRRHRRLYLVTGASVAGMIVASALAYTAIDSRDAARDQRREAESLIGFMLGDLRTKLEPVGRLDVLDAVGIRALEYYEKQDKAELSDEALSQRSRALTLMGEIAFARGDLDGALRRYREAMAGTAEAARRAPDNPEYLFGHAQNIFWVGYIDYQRRDLDKAAAAFREYRSLADRMIALAPSEDRYRLERIYADTNLGTVLMALRRFGAAASAYQASLEPTEALVAKEPANAAYRDQLIELLAWLADAREHVGQLDDALAHRRRQLQLVSERRDVDDGDTVARRQEMSARSAMARLLSAMGQPDQAMVEARLASDQAAWLIRTEPDNTEWLQARTNADFERAEIELAGGNVARAGEAVRQGCATIATLLRRDRSVGAWRAKLQLQCLKLNARVALRSGAGEQALSFARQALVLARTEADPVNRGFETAAAEMTLGDALARSGQRAAARGAYERALAAWPKRVEERPRDLAEKAVLLRQLGRASAAQGLAARLKSIGYRQADYLGRRA